MGRLFWLTPKTLKKNNSMQLNFGKALSDWVAGCSTCSCSTPRKHVLTGKVAASKIIVAFIPALPIKHHWNLGLILLSWSLIFMWLHKTLLQSGCFAKIFVGHVKDGLKRWQLRMSPGVEHHCPCQRRGAHLAPQEWKKFSSIRFFAADDWSFCSSIVLLSTQKQ